MESHEPGKRRHRRRLLIGVAVVVSVLSAVVVVVDRSHGADGPRGWDPRVADLARFVEHERGLRFDHAVPIEFLSDKEFRRRVTGDAEPSDADARELHHLEGQFRALGLVEGKLDLRDAVDQITGEGVIGLYSPDEDRMFVRGDRIGVGMRPTIVHELTHALQAQHFDLDRAGRRTSGEDTAFTSLVEGDALRIQNAYVASRPDAERRTIAAFERQQAGSADFGGVPPILTELFSLPYVFGPGFVAAVAAGGGNRALDRAFRRPPTTEKHILEPASYLAGEKPVEVSPPRLRRGERKVGDADDFGMLSLLLVIGERLPFARAWAAVDGWRGDASVGFRSQGRDCIAVRTRLATGTDAGELLAATKAWAAGRPTASTSRAGTVVAFRSCDPGTSTATTDPGRPRTFEVLQLRAELTSSLAHGGLDRGVAECAADDVLADHDPKELLAVVAIPDPSDPRITKLQRDVATSVEGCRRDR